jgi:hypothetical protein
VGGTHFALHQHQQIAHQLPSSQRTSHRDYIIMNSLYGTTVGDSWHGERYEHIAMRITIVNKI